MPIEKSVGDMTNIPKVSSSRGLSRSCLTLTLIGRYLKIADPVYPINVFLFISLIREGTCANEARILLYEFFFSLCVCFFFVSDEIDLSSTPSPPHLPHLTTTRSNSKTDEEEDKSVLFEINRRYKNGGKKKLMEKLNEMWWWCWRWG